MTKNNTHVEDAEETHMSLGRQLREVLYIPEIVLPIRVKTFNVKKKKFSLSGQFTLLPASCCVNSYYTYSGLHRQHLVPRWLKYLLLIQKEEAIVSEEACPDI